MQSVSKDYIKQSNRTLRNPTHVRVSFGIIDPQAVEASTIDDNGAMAYSEADLIELEQYKVGNRYGRLYDNGFVLDGNLKCVPSSDYEYQGYVSSMLSSEDKSFAITPTLTVDFDEYVTFAGLTIHFDKNMNNYATNMSVDVYANNELIGTETIQNDSSTLIYENTIPSADYTNKIVIKFNETKFPHRDISIDRMLFGIIAVFTDDMLSEASFVRDVDLVNSKLPTENFKFTIIDKDRDYDPENPNGMWKYLEEEQSVLAEMGYELDDGSIEWVQLCEYFTTGETSISSDTIPLVTFESTSILGYLTDDYIGGKYRSDGINLYDLAVEIMSSLRLPLNADGSYKWKFDEEQMSKYTTYMPLSVMPIRDCLQLIASACCCLLYTDRYGNVIIRPHDYDLIQSPQFNLGFADIYSPPTIKKYPLLRNVLVQYSEVVVDSEVKELASQDISVSENTEFTFSYSLSTNQSIIVDGLTVVGTPLFYAETCIVTLNGTGSIAINGKELVQSNFTHKSNYNPTGDDCPMELSLINSVSHAKDYADYVYDYVKLRTEYEVEDRGFMELDPIDTIFADTGYGSYSGVVVARSELSYNGAVKGKTKYYQCVDYSQYVDNAVLVSNDGMAYSIASNVLLPDVEISVNYGRLYENGLILDGNSLSVPNGDYEPQGYVSEVVSDGNGDFEQPPIITISFEKYIISQNGLTFTFADSENFASEMTLKAYLDGELVDTLTLENESSVLYYGETYPSTTSVNKIEIIFNNTNFPYRDIRLNNIYFGRKV